MSRHRAQVQSHPGICFPLKHSVVFKYSVCGEQIHRSDLWGRGEWGGGIVTSCIWHRMDVRAEWPPFSALPSIWLAPFSAKSIWLTPFFWISIWKAPLFCCIPVHAHNFRTEIFEATCSLGIQWIDCYICLPAINGYKKIKGQYMNGSTFQTIWYMNGSVLSKARYMIGGKFWNTGSYTRTTITPKLPLEDQTAWIRRVIWPHMPVDTFSHGATLVMLNKIRCNAHF